MTAVSSNALTSGNNNVGGSSQATASVTPTAGRPVLLFVTSVNGASTVAPTGVSGCGLTWTKQGTSTCTHPDTAVFVMTCWQGLGTPSTGAITITWAASNSHLAWSVFELLDADTTTPIKQIVPAATNSSVTSNSASMAAFTDTTNNLAIGAFFASASGSMSVGSGFTQIHYEQYTSFYFVDLLTEFHSGQDTSIDVSWTGGSETCGFGLEISTPAGAAPSPRPLAALGVGT